jgi:hypothetical protein
VEVQTYVPRAAVQRVWIVAVMPVEGNWMLFNVFSSIVDVTGSLEMDVHAGTIVVYLDELHSNINDLIDATNSKSLSTLNEYVSAMSDTAASERMDKPFSPEVKKELLTLGVALLSYIDTIIVDLLKKDK